MKEITLKNGRLYIPTALVMSVLKPGFGKVKTVMKKNFTAIRWESGFWVVLADEQNINSCNLIFNTKFQAKVVDTTTINYLFKTTPRQCQMEALAAGQGQQGFAYFMEPGLGKTKVVIDEAQMLNRDDLVDTILIICPKSVIPTWLRQIQEHGHSDNWNIAWWDTDPGKSRVEVEQRCKKPDMWWFIVSEGNLIHPTAWDIIYKFLCSSIKTMAVIDESTSIKNVSANRTKRAYVIRDMVEWRRILTGTPMADGKPTDFYAQLCFLDPEIFQGMSFSAFKREYCVLGGYKRREILGYINQVELASTVAQYSYTARKKDYLDLPPRVYETRELTLSPAGRRNYDAIVSEIMVAVKGQTITLDTVGAKIMKLRQLCGGFILPDKEEGKKREAVPMGTEKLDDLKHFMEECRTVQVLIWCFFEHEIHAIHRMISDMSFKVEKYYGATKTKDRRRLEDDFEAGKFQVMVTQVDTGGMGLTLNAASVSYYYSNPTYFLPRTQSEERNYRDGQNKCTTVVDAFMSGTVDESIYRMMKEKKDVSNRFMSAIKDPLAMEELLYPKRKRRQWKNVIK